MSDPLRAPLPRHRSRHRSNCLLRRLSLLALLSAALAACNSGSSTDARLRLVSPSPDGVANAARPVLRWQRHAGADAYRLRVVVDESGLPIDDQSVGDIDEWPVSVDLADGVAYRASVEALHAGLPIARGPESRFRVRLLPAGLPQLELVARDPLLGAGGARLINLLDILPPTLAERIPAMVLVNDHGEVLWHHVGTAPGLIQAPTVLPDGTVLFVEQDFSVVPVAGRALAMHWNGEVTWRGATGLSLHHDVGIGPDGHVLALDWEWQQFGPITYEGDALVLMDRSSGDVIWRWSIFDHFDPITTPTPESANAGLSGVGVDWSHSNAATWDEARGLIWVSVRHFDSLLGVEYPSGDVRVVVGKLGLGGVGLMSHQHAPEVQADGSLLVYDNGNGATPPRTRVVRIAIDEGAGTAQIVETWQDEPAFFDFAVGDANRLSNGNLLVTAGVSGRLIEVAEAFGVPGIAWELRIAGAPRWWMYRSELVPRAYIDPSVLPFSDVVLVR